MGKAKNTSSAVLEGGFAMVTPTPEIFNSVLATGEVTMTTIENAAQGWLTHLETRRRRPAKPATLRTFGNYVRVHIVPRIGSREVGEVGVAVMRSFVSELAAANL